MTKMGRPSKFDKVDMKQVEKLVLAGFTDVQLSDFFGVSEKTWNNWKEAHENFFQSLKNWKLEADHRVERSLYERACGYKCKDTKFATHEGVITDAKEYIKEYAPDTTACIFWLKNRNQRDWRDKQEIEQTNVNVDMTDKELQDRARDLLERAEKNR